MSSNQKIVQAKLEANEAFKSKKYLDAFKILERELSPNEFINYIINKRNWLRDKSGEIFFSYFLSKDNKLSKFLFSESAAKLINEYFITSRLFNSSYHNFESKLIENHKDLYIETVRRNRHFFNEQRILFWTENEFPGLSEHLNVWNTLFQKEKEYWSECEKLLLKASEFNGTKFLSALSGALLRFDLIFKNNHIDTVNGINRISHSVNLLLDYYLFTNRQIEDVSVQDINLKANDQEIKHVFNTLEKLGIWYYFIQNALDVYQNNDSIVVNEGVITQTPEEYYQFKLGQKRLNMTATFFQKRALNLIEDQRIDPEHLQLLVNNIATDLLLKEVKFDSNTTWGKPAFEILVSLSSINKFYSDKITPIHLMDKYNAQRLLKDEFEKWAVFNPDKRSKKFDRYTTLLKSDVYPLIKFGNKYLSIIYFQKHNDWFYSLFDLALKSENSSQQELAAKDMEDHLAQLFREKKGWVSNSEADLTGNRSTRYLDSGDIDVIVEDETAQILIQFKRYSLRTELSKIHNEKNRDIDAIDQLLKGEQSLKQNPSKWPIKNNRKKWLVTTSHEWIGELNSKVRKVNYFDLFQLIFSDKIKTVQDLINYVEGDKLLDDYLTVDPLKLFETKAYNLNLNDNSDEISNVERFNRALEIQKQGDLDNARLELHKCLKHSPYDAEILGAMANTYADLKEWNKATSFFLDALKITPHDPWINRNYGLMLIEKGESLMGIKVLFENAARFPLLSIHENYHRTLKEEAESLLKKEYNANRLREVDILFLRN